MGLELDDICFEEAHEIERRRKVRMAEIANSEGSSLDKADSPFSSRNLSKAETIQVPLTGKQRYDIQNIGTGTRCISCGLLHFCWTPHCAGCGGPMDYNLGAHGK